MALETLMGVEKIGNFEVKIVEWEQPENNFIEINHKHNAITFKIQNGPIKEAGLNGCQVDTIIDVAKLMIEGLNNKFPCLENELAIEKLSGALLALKIRKKNREERGVEGLSKE